jgi:thiamine biosynthesis lipoprotein
MGTSISVLIGPPADPAALPAGAMAIVAQAMVAQFERVLSRFLEDSELSLLNRDPRVEVPASALLRRAVHAGLWAAERTDGLVDLTVLPAVRAAGYVASRAGLASVPLADALATAPPRLPAGARANPVWTSVAVLDDAAAIRRDPGVLIDLGGVGKGLAADLLADRLAGYERFVIDCGGDVRAGGVRPDRWPVEVDVQHPLTGGAVDSFRLDRGAAATSGIDVRLWQREDGSFAHHLIDPATGEPAWTGLIAATARAPTGVEAEALAKAALLSGPAGAPRFLCGHGGLVVHDNGDIQRIPGANDTR